MVSAFAASPAVLIASVRMPAVNEKQGDVPEGARVLENPRGTAPGFWLEKDGVQIGILPGVPSEMREIFEQRVAPAGDGSVSEHTARTVGRSRGSTSSTRSTGWRPPRGSRRRSSVSSPPRETPPARASPSAAGAGSPPAGSCAANR